MSEYKPGIVKDGPDWPLPVCDTNGKLADENARLRARVEELERVVATVQNASADSKYLYRDEAINRLSIIRAALEVKP
jgi:hypothetical protein